MIICELNFFLVPFALKYTILLQQFRAAWYLPRIFNGHAAVWILRSLLIIKTAVDQRQPMKFWGKPKETERQRVPGILVEYSILLESRRRSFSPKLRVPVKRSPYIWRVPCTKPCPIPPRKRRFRATRKMHLGVGACTYVLAFQAVNQYGISYIPALMRFDTSVCWLQRMDFTRALTLPLTNPLTCSITISGWISEKSYVNRPIFIKSNLSADSTIRLHYAEIKLLYRII